MTYQHTGDPSPTYPWPAGCYGNGAGACALASARLRPHRAGGGAGGGTERLGPSPSPWRCARARAEARAPGCVRRGAVGAAGRSAPLPSLPLLVGPEGSSARPFSALGGGGQPLPRLSEKPFGAHLRAVLVERRLREEGAGERR